MEHLIRIRWQTCAVSAVLLLAMALPAMSTAGPLTSMTVANLSPAFDTAVTQYTVPRPAGCNVNVSATLANPAHRLYIGSVQTASGAVRGVWVCDGVNSISVVIYANWNEVGRYTITLVNGAPPTASPTGVPPSPVPPAVATPTPTAAAANTHLSSLIVAGLTPPFSPGIMQYSIVRTAACSVPTTATLTNLGHKLYVAGNFVASGSTTDAWVCDGRTKIDVIVYDGWTEKARYTITLVEPAASATPTHTSTPLATPTSSITATPSITVTPTATLEPSPVPPAATATGTFTSTPVPSPSAPAPTAPPDPQPSPQATSGVPVDAATAERLLHQATFGPTAVEIAAVQTKGVDLWLAEQFALPPGGLADGFDVNQVRGQLFLKMANGQDQLRQRMAFALGQTLVVSTSKLVNGNELIPWVRLLENQAFGNYRTLLRAVTLSPSMGKFLDLANSVGSNGQAPNENYPRELLQLFSIGLFHLKMDGSIDTDQGAPVPTYDQTAVKELARALSGWTYPTAPGQAPVSHNPDYFVGEMEPRPQYHDSGAKTLLGVVLPAGQTVGEDLDDALDIIFNHPNVPPFVATRLIRSLVSSNPSPAYIERIATVFADNGQGMRGDLKAVLTAILKDPDAALPSINDGQLRDPVLHVIGLARALGVQINNADQFMYVMANLGQQVLSPPTVFSFYSPLAPLPGDPTKFGPEFQLYTPALAIQRANFIHDLLGGAFSSSFSVNLAPYNAVVGNPPALVELVNQRLLFGRMSNALRAVLIGLAQQTSDPQQRIFGTLYLTAISSEFAVHTGALAN